MGTFSENLDLRWGMENHKTMWTLLADYSYVANDGTVYTVPKGFKTDLASIPQVFWSVLPPFWRYAKAAVIHDWILVGLKQDPKIANTVFKEGMQSTGTNRQQIFFIYNGVVIWFWVKRKIKKQ